MMLPICVKDPYVLYCVSIMFFFLLNFILSEYESINLILFMQL